MSFGYLLTEADRHDDALSADREAVECYRMLHASHADAFHAALANALGNLAVDLRNLRRDDEAEAVELEIATLHGKKARHLFRADRRARARTAPEAPPAGQAPA
jgi:hypothetical protein